jgi:glutaredoxin 3
MSKDVVITMYTTARCPFCTMAIDFLEAKDVGYTEINIESDPELRKEMENRSERTSVPQIFIGDMHVGGFDELVDLDMDDELDPLLGYG